MEIKRIVVNIFTVFILYIPSGFSQISLNDDIPQIDYANPVEYEIGGITVSGIQNLDNNVLIMLTGLSVGDKITVPGEKITKAIENLWKQGLFEDIKINATSIKGTLIFLDIFIKERPRLSKFSFTGVKKSEADKLREEIKLTKGDVVTENVITHSKNIIKKYFVDKGYLFTTVDIFQKTDTSLSNNSVILYIDIKKNAKIKINKINLFGNSDIEAVKIKRAMKKSKEKHLYRLFATSRFIEDDFTADKLLIIEKFNELGYRDAKIIKDSIYKFDDKSVNINIYIEQGHKYYFRNISWIGNTKYSGDELNTVLKIKKGDIYNQKALEANLYMNAEGRDVSSLYLDDGYLFFSVTPVEIKVENDSIDMEIRVYEGKQAIISKVTISGNTKTNDNVIIREIRTKPGQLFSRSDIIRTQRELTQLKYFNQEKLAVNPKPNAADGTVDIEYVVEEASSDQVELSGGWGAGTVVGTLGLSFNNFAAGNFFKKGAWRPLPSGNGQKLSIRAQSNGKAYQSYNASFTEPWLGGKKPNALSVSAYHSVQTNGLEKSDPTRQSIVIDGISVELGKRLKWPDDYFTLYSGINFQQYTLQNFSSFTFQTGKSNNFNLSFVFGRNSIDAPIYPRTGSELSFTVQATPPFSLTWKKDVNSMTQQEKYRWIEYHKWKFSASLFTKIAGNLVLSSRTKFGFLGYYNSELGPPPFERYYLGGDGLSGFALDGREIIGMRGYGSSTLTPKNSSGYIGGTIFNKYTLELRYPISLNPMATIYPLCFLEAGNSWSTFNNFNPFDIKRSAGVGVRIYLPMFGLLGLDWGYGFDAIPGDASANKGQFHFSINQSID
ncbi:MAG: outer membrane protein assembly factor BamA [Bacteroidetes bacterium]|nr:outer membrane protein assembly factor BamA [Bacteroidota bacterium]